MTGRKNRALKYLQCTIFPSCHGSRKIKLSLCWHVIFLFRMVINRTITKVVYFAKSTELNITIYLLVFKNYLPHCLAYGWGAGNLNWPIRIQHSGKNYCPHVNVSWQERYWNQATFHERGFTISKTISHCKNWKISTNLCLQLQIWRQKW